MSVPLNCHWYDNGNPVATTVKKALLTCGCRRSRGATIMAGGCGCWSWAKAASANPAVSFPDLNCEKPWWWKYHRPSNGEAVIDAMSPKLVKAATGTDNAGMRMA